MDDGLAADGLAKDSAAARLKPCRGDLLERPTEYAPNEYAPERSLERNAEAVRRPVRTVLGNSSLYQFQRTLKNAIHCSGVGVHSGEKVTLTLRPAAADIS